MDNLTIYKDKKGEQITYGDILRNIEIEKSIDFDSPFAVKRPFLCFAN